MPRYIGYRPQFNPISLQEYLAVPTMLQQEYDTYEDKYNENLDKLAVLEGMLDDSTKNYLNAYKNNLNNAADIISGKSGNLSDLRQQTNSARQFYREYAPKLTNAYNKRQAALKAQQDILLKDPSAITTQVGNMQSFLDNPDQLFHSLSGDKIYADMINAGKLSAADMPLTKGKSNFTGYTLTFKGYNLAQQQEYANLVKQALNGDINADKMLKSNPIYAQPYQVLNKYIEDNKFNLFNDSERNYALNRALSGQLMGMTSTENLIADKQWEHNSRMAAARLSQSSDNLGVGRYQMRNHVIHPRDRVASFGKDKEFTKSTGNVFEYKNGKLQTKSGINFYRSIGFGSLIGNPHINHSKLFEELGFNNDGTLRTKDELNNAIKEHNNAIKEHNNRVGYNILKFVGKNYDDFYQQITDLGFNTSTRFNNTKDVIVTRGTTTRPTQSLETRTISRINQFLNALNNLADNINTNNPGNVGFRDIAINTTEESLKNAIKSASDDFTVFTGLTRTDGKLWYNSKGKKRVDKSDIIKDIEKHGGTLEYSPSAKGYIVTIQNKDKDLYFIDEDNWDESVHNYTDIDWEGYANTLNQLSSVLDNAETAYQNNPTSKNYNYYLEVLRRYNIIAQQYDNEWSELERGFGTSEAFSGYTNWNPNTESFHKDN